MSLILLNQAELAVRWRISPRTLERWRWLRRGPAYLKLGGSVAYAMEDVLAYEAAQRRGAHARDQSQLSGPESFGIGLRR